MSDEHFLHESAAAASGEGRDEHAPAAPHEQQLLRQAGDVIENLRAQLAELDRREQNVAAQTTALENEQRRIRLSAQQFDDQMREREDAFREREAALEQRVADWNEVARRREAEQADLQRRQDELGAQRERLRDEVLAELEAERSELDQQRAALERQSAEFQQRYAQGIASLDAEFERQRNSRRAEFDAEALQLAETARAEQSRWEQERAQRDAEFAAERALRQQQLAALRHELDAVREEKLADLERRENEQQRKQVDLEKRTRFHETHLNQLRRSLEQQQAEIDRKHQLAQAEQVQAAGRLDLHRRQLDRYRNRLTQREESLERERHLLDDVRRALETNAAEDQDRRDQDRRAWEHECEAHRGDMRRQQDMLALHAQNLEARRARLDQLRDDLEQTHRETLELRLVVEQVWGQLSQTFGEDATRKRVEQARTELAGGYEKLRGSLIEQQASVDAAEQRLADQRQRFRDERAEFTHWMEQREHQLQAREESLQRDIQLAAQSEAQWQRMRKRWRLEKIEAESVIRQLLDELDADLIPLAVDSPLTPAGSDTVSFSPTHVDDEQSAAA